MIAGHFATALIPAGRFSGSPLWLWFLASMLPDYLYLLLALWGVERPVPAEYWTTALPDMKSEMPYSHSAVAIIIEALAMGGIARLVSRNTRVALWSGGLVLGHFICDLLSGFQHEIAGAGSFEMGLNFYNNSPLAAVLIEVVVSAACVALFMRSRRAAGRSLTPGQGIVLYAVFLGGSLLLLPIAKRPLTFLLGGR